MAATQSTIDLAIVVFRGLVLLIAAFAGLMSIYLGWKLHSQAAPSLVQGEAAGGKGMWRVRLVSMGPGVFFAVFGMSLLGCLVHHKAELDDPVALPSPVAAMHNSVLYPRQSPLDTFPQRLTLAQYQPPQAAIPTQQYVCVVAIRRRVFLNGEGLTPERISADLATAQTFLTNDARGISDPRAASRLEDAIETIDELRQSTGQWQLAH